MDTVCIVSSYFYFYLSAHLPKFSSEIKRFRISLYTNAINRTILILLPDHPLKKIVAASFTIAFVKKH